MSDAPVVPRRARRGRITVLVILLLTLLAPVSHAGEAKLVKDIERASYGCDTSRLIESDGVLYFGTSHRCRSGGLALWRTDGTHAGTSVVRTFEPGARNLDGVQPIASVGGLVYFGLRASDGPAGVVELWRSDGTADGTIRLWEGGADERIDSSFLSEPPRVGEIGGKIVFVVDQGWYVESTLWVSDGTPEGTKPLPDVADGKFSAAYLVRDDTLFLLVYGDTGYALWRTDGTDEGTEPVHHIGFAFGGDLGDSIEVAPDGALYFVVPSAPGVRTLWRTWGTAATTSRVLEIPFASFWVLADGVHYVLEARRQAVRLWRFDPVGLDLELLKLLDAAPIGDNDLDFLGAADGVAYFSHFAFAGFRGRLWRSDGTADGTFVVFDELLRGGLWRTANGFAFTPEPYGFGEAPALWHTDGTVAGTAPILEPSSGDYDDFTPIGDQVALFVASGFLGSRLMRTDGTAAGTSPLQWIGSNPWNFGVLDGVGVFFAGSTLWRSDGSPGGTYRLLELGLQTIGSGPHELIGLDDTLYFAVRGRGGYANELWRSDGTRAGTRAVRDFPDGPDGSLRLLTGGGDGIVFARGASELWTSDGTGAGTALLADTATVTDDAKIEEILQIGETTYAAVRDDLGRDGALWRSDGTPDGTEVVAPLVASHLTSFAGALHFSAPSSDRVAALWKSDGSELGTVALATFSALNRRRRPDVGPLFAGPDAMFFSVARQGRTDLWRSDGTDVGTTRVAALPSFPGSSSKLGIAGGGFVGDLFVFGFPSDLAGGDDLWVSDGTEAGTQPIAATASYGVPVDFVPFGGRLLFRSYGDSPTSPFFSGVQLWVTDGTAAGTELLLDGDVHGAVGGALAVAGDVTYFCATTLTEDERMWQTDGTVGGTVPAFGRALPCRYEVATTSGRLFFSADTERYGLELWSALLDPN